MIRRVCGGRLLIAIAAVCFLGCDRASEGPPDAVGGYLDLREFQREDRFLLESLSRAHAELSAGEAADLHGVEVIELDAKGLVLQTGGAGNNFVEWPIDLNANDTFELELAAISDQPCVVRFFWRQADEPFDFKRSTAWPMPVPGKQRARRTVRGRPGFTGTLVEVRLQIESAQPVRLEVEDFLAFGWDADFGLVDSPSAELQSVRFGNEVRPAFFLGPGDEYVQSIPRGRWQLRGAAVHSADSPRRLTLRLTTRAGEIETRSVEIGPVAPADQLILWTPIVWDIELEEEVDLVYEVEDEAGPETILVAQLKPIRRREEPSPRAVLVSLDTVRADALGVYGAEGDPTPSLDRLAARSWVFEHAYSTSSWTLPSHMSMLTGFWPARHAVEGGNRSYSRHNSGLARQLREAGYWTEAWTEGGFVDPRFGFAHGFDRFVVLPSNHMMAAGVAGSLAALAETPGPIFMFLHTYQAHAPYDPDPESFARYAGRSDGVALPARTELWNWMEQWRQDGVRLPQDKLDLLRAAYRAGLVKVDRLMQGFFDGLDALPPGEREILIVTSDHGDVFQERSNLLEHGQELQPELLAVPLIISTGRALDVGRRSEVASIADIPATLLDLLEVPRVETDGRALLADPTSASLERTSVQAGVQPPFEASYRLGRIEAGHVDSIEVGPEVGTVDRMERGRLARGDEPATRQSLSDLWAENHRGRTEIAIRFESPQSGFPIRIRSSGEVVDAVAWPSVSAPVQILDRKAVQLDLVPSRPTHWVSLLLELNPPDAGLVVEVPSRAGPLRWICGGRSEIRSGVECAEALGADSDSTATLSAERPGWVRIVRHEGKPFRSAGDAIRDGTDSPSIDSNLAAQLEALGYGGVEVGRAEGEARSLPVPKAAEPQAGEVELVRVDEGA